MDFDEPIESALPNELSSARDAGSDVLNPYHAPILTAEIVEERNEAAPEIASARLDFVLGRWRFGIELSVGQRDDDVCGDLRYSRIDRPEDAR